MSESAIEINLGHSLTLKNVTAFHETHASKLNAAPGSEYHLVGGEIDKIDTAALQLLFLYIKEFQLHECRFLWDSMSDELKEAIELVGLNEQLNCAPDKC